MTYLLNSSLTLECKQENQTEKEMRVDCAISRKTVNSAVETDTYILNEKQRKGRLEGKRQFIVIHQEITGIKGMWFHQPAGGDELELEGGLSSG